MDIIQIVVRRRRRLRTARGRAAPPRGQPPIFSSCEEEKNGPLGGPKEKNWSRRDRCGADLHARAGCARHGQNHDRIPPQADTSGLLSGWQTHGICFSFRCCSPYLTVVRSEAERAGPEVCQIRRPPTKEAPKPPNAGKHFPGFPRVRRTRYKPSNHYRTDHDNLRVCGQLDTRVSS